MILEGNDHVSMFRKSFQILGLAVLLAAALITAPAQALDVRDVRFGQHPEKIRLVLDLSQKTDFRVFTMANPWRLIIDMPDFTWQAGIVTKAPGSGVTDIRQGPLQPGISRIVMDLASPVTVANAFILPAGSGIADRLVIDFSRAPHAQPSRIFGNLKVTETNSSSAETRAPRVPATPSGATTAQSLGQLTLSRETGKPVMQAETPPPAYEHSGMVLPARKPAVESYGSPADPAPVQSWVPSEEPNAAPLPRQTAGKPLIVIDAGHGGEDPGAAGANGVHEKKVTLAMAKELKRQLEESGRYKVKMTRETDVYLRLHQRVNIAHEAGADLFVSLHADSIGRSNVRGASIYTLSDKASDAQTEKLAMRENRSDLIAGIDLSAEDEVVVNILVDLTMRDTMNQSRFLANTLVKNLSTAGVRTLENPHRYAGFAVLKAPDVPSVLIETGYMSNDSDARLLTDPAYQRTLCKAIMTGIDGYFSKVRTN